MFVGEVSWWPGAGNIPEGKLICDGSLYLPSEYPDLFAAVGTTWGGDGISSFGVPNLQGIFPGAIGTQDINGNTKGSISSVIGDYSEDQTQQLIGEFNGPRNAGTGAFGAFTNISDSADNSYNTGTTGRARMRFDSADSPDARTGEFTDVSKAIGRWLIASTPSSTGGGSVNTYKDWVVVWAGSAITVPNTWGTGRFSVMIGYDYNGVSTLSNLKFTIIDGSINQFESAATDQAGSDSVISVAYDGATTKDFRVTERGSDFNNQAILNVSRWELVTP